MADADVLFQLLAELVAVHAGHHDVAHNNVGQMLAGQLQHFHAIGSGDDLLEMFTECFLQEIQHFGVVVGYQHGVGRRIEAVFAADGWLYDLVGDKLVEVSLGLADDFGPFVPEGKFEVEGGTSCRVVVGSDFSSVLFNKNFGVGESYAGSVLFAFGLVETFEELVHVDLFQPAALVGNGYAYLSVGSQFGSDADGAAFRTVFQCVDQQIAEYNLAFLLVEAYVADAGG